MANQAQQCQACGADNSCAVANQTDAARCWCMASPLKTEQRQRVQETYPDEQCLCQSCLQAFKQGLYHKA